MMESRVQKVKDFYFLLWLMLTNMALVMLYCGIKELNRIVCGSSFLCQSYLPQSSVWRSPRLRTDFQSTDGGNCNFREQTLSHCISLNLTEFSSTVPILLLFLLPLLPKSSFALSSLYSSPVFLPLLCIPYERNIFLLCPFKIPKLHSYTKLWHCRSISLQCSSATLVST